MLTRRSFLAGGAAMATAFGCFARAEKSKFNLIVPGVWLYQGNFLANGRCNSIIIERRGDIVVVDANSASGASDLQAGLHMLSPKPVRYVLLTHHHGDHIYGDALWTRAGASTLAHQSMLAELKRLEPGRWQKQAATDPELSALGIAPEPPRQTFEQSPLVLDDGERRIEVHHFGPAHTRDDVVVFLPHEKVLCSGDIAISTSLNSFFDSDFAHWLIVLEKVSQMEAKYVLPGHGNPGGAEILSAQAQFLNVLNDATDKGLRKGQTPEQIAAGLKVADALKPLVSSYLPNQIAQICEQKSTRTK
jgi:cyclase